MRSRARWRMRCHVGPSYHASFWKPNVRCSPGAMSAAVERGLDRDRAGAAHRVEQRRAGRPSGQREHAGREVLAQRRDVGVAPPAALEQRLARRVEIERRLALGEVRVDAHVRPLLVDRGAHARIGAEAVAHGVLHLERRELEARERRARRRDVDAQRARGGEMAPPVDRLWRARRARPRCDSGRARPATGCGSRAATRDWRGRRARRGPAQPTPPSAGVTNVAPERRQFRGERGLEPARAGREEALGHRRSRRRVSTSAT